MKPFILESYEFDEKKSIASFHYNAGGHAFTERLHLAPAPNHYDHLTFEKALFLAFVLIGTSYYKAFPSREVVFANSRIDQLQADFFNKVYQEGMSQFAFENALKRDDLAHFVSSTDAAPAPTIGYVGEGILALQSGGKDSLLTATLLQERDVPFVSFYISSTTTHPTILDELPGGLVVVRREIDMAGLRKAKAEGGLNGHVPVTFIVLAVATLQAILLGKKTILASVGHEGEEPHEWIGDLAVNHQWAKTWPAEQLLAAYMKRYVSHEIQVGSPLRSLSEFHISQLFAERAWQRFGHSFSSCNLANYEQGANNQQLTWCGVCPKCANAFILFAPFIAHEELTALFGGKDLFTEPALFEAMKGLLGVDGVMKPFECVGEIDELRYAYHMSEASGYARLPFAVPESSFDPSQSYEAQAWALGLAR